MIIPIFLLIPLLLIFDDAQGDFVDGRNNNERRRLRMRMRPFPTRTICRLIGERGSTTYQTERSVDLWAALRYILITRTAIRGSCGDAAVCESLCQSKDFQNASGSDDNGLCQCSVNNYSNDTISCDANSQLSADRKNCDCMRGYKSDNGTCLDMDECSSSVIQSGSAPLCASNQLCTNTAGSYKCDPRTCANPQASNPCGPASACTDTPTGYTCEPLFGPICPAGCNPNESCVVSSDQTTASCQCNAGFHRPVAYLPCVVL